MGLFRNVRFIGVEPEVRSIAESVSGYSPQPNALASEIYHPTDLGNARRLVDRFGQDLKYVSQWGWMVWDGQRWAKDETGEVDRRAKDTVRGMYEEASKVE